MSARDGYDVLILGSGIAGLAGALAAHELGLRPAVLEKAAKIGGGTVNSYGLIWVGQNHLAQAAGYADSRMRPLPICGFSAGARSTKNGCRALSTDRPKRCSSSRRAACPFASCAVSRITTTAMRRAR